MNFKAIKTLSLIAICCCISLFGTISYLEPIRSKNIVVDKIGVEIAPIAADCNSPRLHLQPVDFRLTYAATMPGSIDYGILIYSIFNSVPVVNIDVQNNGIFGRLFLRRGSTTPDNEPAIRHTSYPYIGNKQPPPPYYAQDGGVSRAFVLVRNPLRVISDSFTLDASDWSKWSKVHFDVELMNFERFISYWLDSYTPQNRLVVHQESLYVDQTSIPAIMALNRFLCEEAIDIETASCIWRRLVQLKVLVQGTSVHENRSIIQQPISEQNSSDEQSDIIPLLSEFPYTVEQFSKAMKLLEKLSERYKDDEQVYQVLIHYHEEVAAAKTQIEERQKNSPQLAALNSVEPLKICGRSVPFPLSTEIHIARHYASQCPLFKEHGNQPANPNGLLLIRGYDRFGRTGNNLIEFLHALQYGQENNVIVGVMLDSWPMALITKFWMAFPTNNLKNEEFQREGIGGWKEHIERAFCIRVFLNEDELVKYDNIIELTSRELFMFRYKVEVNEYVQFQLHNIRMLFRSYNIGVGKDVKNRNVGDLCSVIDGIFGKEGSSITYSVIHSRTLEGAPGLRLLGQLSETSGCDPVAALKMEPEYVKAILSPLGLLKHPILFITDHQRQDILEKLMDDAEIGPQIRVVSNDVSWVGGDLAAAIMATAFIGNPASTFSGFIAKSRIALGFGNNFLFRTRNEDGDWIDSCEDRCIFYKWVMRSMA